MKILQIWINDYMPDNIKKYCQSVRDNTDNKENEYFFIGNEKNININISKSKIIILNPKKEIDKCKLFLKNKDWWNNYATNNMFISDMIRMSYAMQNNDLLYVDADCEFISKPIIKDINNPNIAKNGNRFDFFLFYSGNMNWWEILNDLTINNTNNKYSFMEMFRKISRKEINITQPIKLNENFYIHHNEELNI